MKENYCIVYASLSGSLQNCKEIYVLDMSHNSEEAEEYARESCNNLIERYSNHLSSYFDEISDLEGDEYDEAYQELVESWSTYSIYPYNDENVKSFINMGLDNPYKKEMTELNILSIHEQD